LENKELIYFPFFGLLILFYLPLNIKEINIHKYMPYLVNYSLLGEMLECARNLDLKYLSKNSALGVRVNERFDTLVDRCRIILDSERVCFYNMDIREAVNNVEGLVGCADVVIDNFGPCLYTGTEKNVMKLEKKLSAPWGVFFVNDGKG